MAFWNRKAAPIVKVEPKPSPDLKPGDCECGHPRCCHKDGTGTCYGAYRPDKSKGQTEWTYCACVIFIRDEDNDDDESPEPEPDPSVKELERMTKL